MTCISRVVFFALSLNFAAFCGQHPTCPAPFLLDPVWNELGAELACPEVCDFVVAIRAVKSNVDSPTQKVDPLELYKKAFDELIRTHPDRAECVAYLQKLS